MVDSEIVKVLKDRVHRLNPHRGMVIDVPTWSAAHGYHELHHRLHLMTLHGPGIVKGLQVTAWQPADNSVIVHPGLALDGSGNVVMLGDAQRIQISSEAAGTRYVVASYREIPQRDGISSESEEHDYVLEGFQLEERGSLPEDAPYVELARLQVTQGATEFSNALDTNSPDSNEIDTRYRKEVGWNSSTEVRISVPALDGKAGSKKDAGAAIVNVNHMVRTGFQQGQRFASITALESLEEALVGSELIILAGSNAFSPSKSLTSQIQEFISAGGTLFCEAVEPGTDFEQSIVKLSGTLGVELAQVGRGSRLLTNPNMFAAPPAGGTGGKGNLVYGGGVIFSNRDYLSLWGGGAADSSPTRSEIRDAMEFGHNIIGLARDRKSSTILGTTDSQD